MKVCETFPTAEAILAIHRPRIGRDYVAYRNHVYRVLNLFGAIAGTRGHASDTVQVAAAFHDIGIWTHHTFDYLEPSVEEARAFIATSSCECALPVLEAMIRDHHKIRRIADPALADAEAFRRADLVDLSLGLVRFGVPGEFVRAIRTRFPNAGFHRLLLRETARQFARSPLRPLPMFHW
ncbi:MAG: HD domain-containing protein [Burkholderiaceae bacterium]|nr:HD domain-containing protein [Burkholderiaceae bacterium]